MSPLSSKLKDLAHLPVLLVASDYDGTLAPIVDDPAEAQPDREAVVALRMLASMPQTHVAVISGRALKDLAARIGEDNLHLVGSHGSEFDETLASRLPREAQDLRETLARQLRDIAARSPRFIVEEKPAAFAFHYRRASEPDTTNALGAIMAGPARLPGVHLRYGKKVVELSVVETNKGDALQRVRQRAGASGVLFMGDDLTDEDAFATLTGPDIGVKIGPGDTRAPYRIEGSEQVAHVLAELADFRNAWLAGSGAVPIERHSLLSDQRALTLLDPAGRVVWMCLPRLDSPAVFAELLGGPSAGYFELSAVGQEKPRRQFYDGDTFILKTEWEGLSVTDYLDCSLGRAFQRAGRTDLVRVMEGRGRAIVRFAPRLDFGRLPTRIHVHEQGLQVAGGRDQMVLYAPGLRWTVSQEGEHQTAAAEIELSDEPIVVECRYGTASFKPPAMAEPARREQTRNHWTSWSRSLVLPKVAREHVLRSALVLRALSYGPTGAIAAAATTSLPECLGGVRNWDYRHCWPRDAALAAGALVRLGAIGGAMKFLDWVLGVMDQCESPDRLAPVYTVTGGNLGPEADLPALAGYAGSRPVRIGNAAAQQVQLDVFGPIADLISQLAERGSPLSSEHWRVAELMVDAVKQRWREPDHGIWEPRRLPQHHLHSKVMCWQTVDRAIAIGHYLGSTPSEWSDLKRVIAEDVLQHTWREENRSFSATYDSSDIDAAALSIGLSGMIPPDDPRFRSTVERIERKLRSGPTVFRYRYDDGLPGFEGGFHLCTTWLVEAYALIGRRADAENLFQQYLSLVGPTGLLSEQYDPRTRRALGNYPQAYSHLGLINAALRLDA